MHIVTGLLSRVKWAAFVVYRKGKSRLLRLKPRLAMPPLPRNPGGGVLIHLGCGDINSPEFINVDARAASHVHYVRDVTDLSIFPDNHADLIYACHVLEHVRHVVLKRTLWEWRRVLKHGGVLRLSVPDFDKMIHIYETCGQNMESILAPLMGGQGYAHNVHYCAFNRTYLANKLKEVGFVEIRSWNPDQAPNHAFKDWANTALVTHGQMFPISLNLEAVK